jgi:hypothetical protein
VLKVSPDLGIPSILEVGLGQPGQLIQEKTAMERPLLLTSVFAGSLLISPLGQATDLRDIELRRLFEPTPAELRAEQAGRVYIYEGLQEADIALALAEQFTRASSMMFIRVKPTPAAPTPGQDGDPTRTYYQDDGC